MGDRTFSGEDVIRIYEFFLTSAEQEVVDFFFFVEPEEVEQRDIVPQLQEISDNLSLLRVTLPALLGVIIRFAVSFLPRFSAISVAVTNASNVLAELIEGEVDA